MASTLPSKKRASIITIGLPWDDPRVKEMGADPLVVKKGIETISTLMQENGFTEAGFTSIQASDRTGLSEFIAAIRPQKRDALFLGGGLKEDGPFRGFREEVIRAAREVQPGIKVVQVSLMKGPVSVLEAAEEVERGLGTVEGREEV